MSLILLNRLPIVDQGIIHDSIMTSLASHPCNSCLFIVHLIFLTKFPSSLSVYYTQQVHFLQVPP